MLLMLLFLLDNSLFLLQSYLSSSIEQEIHEKKHRFISPWEQINKKTLQGRIQHWSEGDIQRKMGGGIQRRMGDGGQKTFSWPHPSNSRLWKRGKRPFCFILDTPWSTNSQFCAKANKPPFWKMRDHEMFIKSISLGRFTSEKLHHHGNENLT